jgi:hypothetical protein
MLPSTLLSLLALLPFSLAQDNSGYTDYSLTVTDPDDTLLYETANTPGNPNAKFGPPDVSLNASVSVGEINILVANLSAKIDLDLQILNLVQFNAGVNLEIGKVNLLIQNVSARVKLEARLENLLKIVEDTLDSIDLNPIIATLGEAVGDLTGELGDSLGGATGSTGGSTNGTGLDARSLSLGVQPNLEFEQNILFSKNNYQGNKHTNRVLAQNGDIVDQKLDNSGFVFNQKVVGNYKTDMTPTGRERTGVIIDGQSTTELEYVYLPFAGLEVVSKIFVAADGSVVATRVFVEIEGGGNSSIAADEENGDDDED